MNDDEFAAREDAIRNLPDEAKPAAISHLRAGLLRELASHLDEVIATLAEPQADVPDLAGPLRVAGKIAAQLGWEPLNPFESWSCSRPEKGPEMETHNGGKVEANHHWLFRSHPEWDYIIEFRLREPYGATNRTFFASGMPGPFGEEAKIGDHAKDREVLGVWLRRWIRYVQTLLGTNPDPVAIAELQPTPIVVESDEPTTQRGPPTIWHHGGQSYSSDGLTPKLVNAGEHNALKCFLDRDESLATETLQDRGVTNPTVVLNGLKARYGEAVHMPGRKGDGYFIRVRSKQGLVT